MRNHFEYDIEKFTYDKETLTLSADEEDLYHYYRKYDLIFPNKGKMFFIKNKKTNNRRAFILCKETESHYHFSTKTENDSKIDKIQEINCIIKKLIFIW